LFISNAAPSSEKYIFSPPSNRVGRSTTLLEARPPLVHCLHVSVFPWRFSVTLPHPPPSPIKWDIHILSAIKHRW
jgi:hypothetical protein